MSDKKVLLGASTIDWTTFDPSVLQVGDEITAPSAYGFDTIVFEVVDKDHVTVEGKDHTVTLQTKFCLTDPNLGYYTQIFSVSSSQIWESSTIKTWLNTETAPTASHGNFLGSFLLDSSGNPKTGSDLAQAQAFIAAIQKPTLKTYTSATTFNEVATCKVWLPSVKQMGGGTPSNNWGIENTCLKKYEGIEHTVANTKRVKTTTLLDTRNYWCRSAYSTSSATRIYTITTRGGFSDNGGTGKNDVVPLITFAYDGLVKHRVTFDFYRGDEHVTETQLVNDGGSATPPEGYDTRTGYDFVAWDKILINITADQTITASYAKKKYTVSFDTDGGSTVPDQTVEYQSKATRPATNPTKVGHTFVDWYTDAECTAPYNFDTQVTGSFTLYAKWDIISYTVTFVYSKEVAGTSSAHPNVLEPASYTKSVPHGSTVEPPPDYLLEHWTFKSWDKVLTNITEDQTITATYEINKYTVTFKYYSGEEYIENAVTDNYGTEITYPETQRTGYDLASWRDDSTSGAAPARLLKTFSASAIYNIKSYTVTFKYHSGTDPDEKTSTQQVDYKHAAVPPTDYEWVGHTFIKWSGDYSSITSDSEYTAIYDVIKYTVTFNTDGGSSVPSQSVTYGEKITKPTDPTKEGHTFEGWFRDAEFTIAFNFDDPITTDITVYAKFEIIGYDVTFDYYQGTEHKTEVRRVEHGGTASAPTNYQRTGYTFVEWDKPRTNITEDQTITAVYTINTYTVTVNYYQGDTLKTETQNVEYGGNATAPTNYARTGYDFVRWSDAFTNITGDRTINAEYTIHQYTVTFKYYNGTEEKTSEDKVPYKGAATAPTEVTRTGYNFDGWDKSFDVIEADTIVTAKYVIKTFTVQINYYQGTVLKNDFQNVPYGGNATVPSNYERTGHTFTGWSRSFTNITDNTVIDANYDINSYTVIFDYFADTVKKTDEQSVDYGHAAVAPSYYQRTGYDFVSWSCAFDNIVEDTLVEANYSIKKFTVTFVTDGKPVPAQQTVDYGAKATKPTNPTKPDKHFVAWYTDEACTQLFDFDTAITENVTLYSKFAINVYDVTFNYYQGKTAKTTTIGVEHGSSATPPTDVERTGYNFIEWDKSLDNIRVNTITNAVYEKKTYTVSFDTNGATLVDAQLVKYQECAVKPATDPVKTGCTFKGWYADPLYTTVFNFSTKIEEDTVVYAWMDPYKYKLTYVTNGGSKIDPNPQIVNYGESPVEPPDPTKEGCNFYNWYANEALTEVFNFGVPMYADATIYAKWIETTPTLSKVLGRIQGNEFVLDKDDGRYALKLVDDLPAAPTDSDTHAVQMSRTVGDYQKGDIFVFKGNEWVKVESPTETVLSVSNIVCPRVNQDVQVRWNDPEDRDPFTWKHTRLLRKYGEYPRDIFDGVIVTDSYVRDQYSKLTFHDFVPAGTEDGWYYRFFTFSEDEVPYSSDADKFRPIELSWYTIGTIVQNGLASRVFAIGDTVTVTPNSDYKDDPFYNGMKLVFSVVAFNQATPEDFSKKYSITFALVDTFSNYTANWDTGWPEYRLTTDMYVTDRTKVYYIFDGSKYVPAGNLPMGKRLTPGMYYEKNNEPERTLHGGNRWASSSLRTWLNSTDASNKRVFFDKDGVEHSAVPPLVALQKDFVQAITTTRNTNALPLGADRASGDYEISIDKFYLLSKTEVFNDHAIHITYQITTDTTPQEYYSKTTDTVRDKSKTYYIYRAEFNIYQKATAADFNPDGSFKSDVIYYELIQKDYYRYDRTLKTYVVCTSEFFTPAHEFLEKDPSDPTGETPMVYYDQIISDVEENPYIPYYDDEDLKPRICHDSDGNPRSWWLRSADIGTLTNVHCTSKDGELMEESTIAKPESYDKTHHVIFGFSIS